MKVHNVTVSAFCAKEGAAALKDAMLKILPQGAAIEENVLEPETEGEVFLKEIVELKARLTKQPDIKAFVKTVVGGLDEYDRRKLKERLKEHVDEECNLYLRLSKEEASKGKVLLEYKDPIHITFKMAAYPAKLENALAAAGELLDETL